VGENNGNDEIGQGSNDNARFAAYGAYQDPYPSNNGNNGRTWSPFNSNNNNNGRGDDSNIGKQAAIEGRALHFPLQLTFSRFFHRTLLLNLSHLGREGKREKGFHVYKQASDFRPVSLGRETISQLALKRSSLDHHALTHHRTPLNLSNQPT